MPVTVVVGGQYGSEGKGKLISYLASTAEGPLSVVRCGGSNAGHTATANGRTYKLRQLPSGALTKNCRLYMAAGMLIDLPVLARELEECNIGPERLCIDRNAVLITDDDRAREVASDLGGRIGSTLTGTGSATAQKVLRDKRVVLASGVPELKPYIGNVSAELNRLLDEGEHVIVEGTQGYGLSLHHSDFFPFATSRDTTAAAFLSEVGLSPLLVAEILLVLRTYPIRVAGNSGPLYSELDWEAIRSRSNYPNEIAEFTTVTGNLRRVGEFDWNLASQSVAVNRPTAIALHGADYLSHADYGKRNYSELTPATRRFAEEIERRLGVTVRYIFTGPGEEQLVDRRGGPESTTGSMSAKNGTCQ